MLDLGDYLVKPSALNTPEQIILYGKPGGGKSWLAASASLVQELSPVLIIDTEGSTAGTVAGFPDENLDILPITVTPDDLEQFDEVTDAVRDEIRFQKFNQIVQALVDQKHKYKTVIIDTLDVAQTWAEGHFKRNAPITKNGERNTLAAYGELKEWTVKLVRNLKGGDFLSILVYHESIEKTETGAMVSEITMVGSARAVVPGIPDIVGRVKRYVDDETEKEVTEVFFGSGGDQAATKNRFSLPVVMYDPTMQDVIDAIKENNK